MLPHLETFVAAAESGSFTAAARALGVTQAAVSQRVQALEGRLGRALFRREGGRVALTESGRRLHRYGRRLLTLDEEARAAVAGVTVAPAGELLLAASSVPGEHLLPRLLAQFRRRHRHIHVRATVLDSSAVFRQVLRGKAHLGLVGDRREDPHLELRPFAIDRLVLVVPRRHVWRRRASVSLEELTTQPLLVREPGSGSRACLEQALGRVGRGLGDFSIAAELGSNEAIKEAVLHGLGVAFLSCHALDDRRAGGSLHSLRVSGLTLEREMYVVQDRRRALPIAAQHFLATLPRMRQS